MTGTVIHLDNQSAQVCLPTSIRNTTLAIPMHRKTSHNRSLHLNTNIDNSVGRLLSLQWSVLQRGWDVLRS